VEEEKKKKKKKRVGFLVDIVALEQVFLQVLHFSLTISFDQRHSFAFVFRRCTVDILTKCSKKKKRDTSIYKER
jgi:hypothetical protein